MLKYKVKLWFQGGTASFSFGEQGPVDLNHTGFTNIRKAVFSRFDDDRPVLVLNAVSIEGSKLETPSPREIKITIHIRCLLLSTDTIKMVFNFSDEREDNRVTIHREGGESYRPHTADIFDLLAAIETGKAPTIEVFDYNTRRRWLDDPTLSSFDPRKTSAIEEERVKKYSTNVLRCLFSHAEEDWTNSNPYLPRVSLFFLRSKDLGYSQVGFSATGIWAKPHGDSLRCFDLGEESLFGVDPECVFSLTQIPAPEVGQRVSAADAWLLEVAGLPSTGLAGPWNAVNERYVQSLQWLGGSRPISWLPKLYHDLHRSATAGDLAVCAGAATWSALFEVRDCLPDKLKLDDDDFEVVGKSFDCSRSGKLQVRCISIYPLERGCLSGFLPLIRNHRDEHLECLLPFAPPTALALGDDRSCRIALDGYAPTRMIQMVERPGILLSLGGPIFALDPLTGADQPGELDGARDVRIGALDLRFRKPLDLSTDEAATMCGYLYQRFDPRTEKTRAGIDVRLGLGLEASFLLERVLPGGQDETADGFEDACVDVSGQDVKDEECRRPPPLVIPWGDRAQEAHGDDNLLLRVVEHHDPERDHRVDLDILSREPPGGTKKTHQVVILERDPFFVGKLAFPAFETLGDTSGSLIATWRNQGLDAATWSVRAGGQAFRLALPAQGVGEEMEKYKADRRSPDDEKDGRLLDFRLAPPAEAELRTTYFRQNFPEPPWNLRRILGFAGREIPGAVVEHLQYELLYGLSCSLDYPLLRLAEIEAVVGPPPRALPQDPVWLPQGDLHEKVKKAYEDHRDSWWRLYKRLRSRLAVFEAWDEATRDTLELKDDVTCRIRVGADMRDPFSDDATKLAGGVTWGFESKNVYDAVMRPGPNGDPQSNSADVMDLFLSSLGGWGRQKATFDEKRTAIYADTAMGHTYSYRLERIGRIGVWWNVAKHVIIYRRTVAPSEQFTCDQNPLLGRPVLRKVEEYVEILEERRDYPDDTDRGGASALRGRGFVEACVFEKGARFPVRSDWGSEVRKVGWKVPIWRPGLKPRDLYLKPTVKLVLTAHVDGERRPNPRAIADPENLYFYTDTQVGIGPDPDKWAPVEGVDYVDLPRPQAAVDFQHGELRRTTPPDVPVPPGFSPCTFRLEPSAHPVDLVAERGLEPMGAHLETVTLARASAVKRATLPGRKELADGFTDLLRRLPERAEDLTQEVREEIRRKGGLRLCEAIREVDGLRLKIGKVQDRVWPEDPYETAEDELKKRFEEKLPALRQDLEKRLGTNVVKTLRKLADPSDCEQDVDGLKERLKEQATRRIRQEVKGAVNKARDEVERLRYSPGVLVQAVGPGLDAAIGLLSQSVDEIDDLDRRLATVKDLGKDQVKGLSLELKALGDRLANVEETIGPAIAKASEKRPWSGLPNPATTLQSLIKALPNPAQLEALRKKLLAAGGGFVPKLIQDVRTQLRALKDELEKATDELRNVRDGLDGLVGNLEQARREWFEKAEADLAGEVDRRVLERIDAIDAVDARAVCDEVRQIADQVKGELEESLRKVWGSEEDPKLKAVYDGVKHLSQKAKKTLGSWTDPAKSKIGKGLGEVEALLDNLSSQGQDLRGILEKKRDELLAEVDRHYAEVKNLVDDGTTGAADLYATAQPALRVIRAFGKPPEVSGLTFDDPTAAFFFDEVDKKVGITPIIARAAQVSQAVEALKPLGVDLPTTALEEKLIPQALKDFDLSKILPDFGGLDLRDLFKGIKMPETSDAVDVQHGFDKKTKRPWLKATIDVRLPDRQPVFSLGPLALWISDASFTGRVSVEATQGLGFRRTAVGSIAGNWELWLGGLRLVTIRETELHFDEDGKLRFDIDPKKIEIPEALSFITELLESFLSDAEASGISVNLLADGVEASMALPIPDLQGGTFGISGMTLFAALQLRAAKEGFALGLDFALARKEVPFTLTIFILGGAGYVDAQSLYYPGSGKLVSEVSLALMASASLAISLGPISGGVYVYFGVTGHYASDGPRRGLTIGIVFLVRGHVSVLSIASASIALMLEAQYLNGTLVGRGTVSLKIKICWCFTLKVRQSVTYTLAGGGGGGGNAYLPDHRRPVTRLAHLDPRAADLPPRLVEPWRPETPDKVVREAVGDWIDLLI